MKNTKQENEKIEDDWKKNVEEDAKKNEVGAKEKEKQKAFKGSVSCSTNFIHSVSQSVIP